MKKRTLLRLGISTVLAAAVLGWYVLQREASPENRPAARRLSAAMPGHLPPGEEADPTRLWQYHDTPEFKRIALERSRKWLESRGRDAAGLIAVWDLTSDDAVLAEAAEKFPNDPRVCCAMIHNADKDAQKALPWIERLIAAEPKNPEGYYLKSWALMAGDDRNGALAALRTAASVNAPRDIHLRERLMSVREAAIASGASVGDAAYLALAAPMERSSLYTPLGNIVKLIRTEMADAKASASDERLMETAGLGLAIAGQLTSSSASVVIDSLVGSTLEKMILSQLSDDTGIGSNGTTVAQAKKEADARRQTLDSYFKQVSGTDGVLENSSDAVKAEFTDRFLLHGEVVARNWLIKQAGTTAPQQENGK